MPSGVCVYVRQREKGGEREKARKRKKAKESEREKQRQRGKTRKQERKREREANVNQCKGVLLLWGRFVSLDCQQVALVGLFLIDVICLSWGSFVSLLKIPTNETGVF